MLALQERISKEHATSSVEVSNQLHELVKLVQGISLNEVLEKLEGLGFSVSDIKGLIEENQPSDASAAALFEIRKV